MYLKHSQWIPPILFVQQNQIENLWVCVKKRKYIWAAGHRPAKHFVYILWYLESCHVRIASRDVKWASFAGAKAGHNQPLDVARDCSANNCICGAFRESALWRYFFFRFFLHRTTPTNALSLSHSLFQSHPESCGNSIASHHLSHILHHQNYNHQREWCKCKYTTPASVLNDGRWI